MGCQRWHAVYWHHLIYTSSIQNWSLFLQSLLPAASAVMLAGNKVAHKNAMVLMSHHINFLVFAQTTFYFLVYAGALAAKLITFVPTNLLCVAWK